MNWEEVRKQHPRQWLLVEAIRAYSEDNHRVVEDLAVLGPFADSTGALQRYNELHQLEPQRELYVLHTDREQLDIQERHWLGIRSAR
jgi:hypothetical protein